MSNSPTPHHTHLCLVSAQATPNLLPLLDERLRPQRVVLACSPQMREAAHALRTVIQTRAHGTKIETLELPDAYDYNALANTFLEYLGEHEDEDIALNVTGGTKLMAVAAQEVFRSNDKPVFYVSVESDELMPISTRATPPVPLQARIKVHEMLRAHGHPVIEWQTPQISAERRELAARIAVRVQSAGPALGLLNALAARARTSLQAQLDTRAGAPEGLDAIIGEFEDAGLLEQRGSTIHFPDEEARTFVNGGWLEHHAYQCLQNLRARHAGLSDVALGVRIAFDTDPARSADKNELDVACLYRHTLHIIECKTANLSQVGTSGTSKATEALYKLESLLKLGGLRTRGMIIDYRGEFASSAANRRRACEAGIAIVSGKQLRNLEGAIERQWFTKQ